MAGIGWLLRGIRGAVVALFAVSIPCSLIALIVTVVYEFWSRNRFVVVGLRGALAAAVGVRGAAGWTLILPFWKSITISRLVLFTGGALVLGLLSISPISILFLVAFAGFLWPER